MSEIDGWITIGTKLDNSELEKQYRKLTSELKEKQKENEQLTKIKVKIETEYDQAKADIEEFTNERLAAAVNDEEANQALITEERELKILNEDYSAQFEKLEEINAKINENVNSQELLKQQIEQTNQELQKTKHFNEIKKSINDIGKSIRRVTRQVVHWGLAIFGVRSAYLFVRQAMSTLSGYNEKIATDLQYIRFALASTLQPVIEYIIKLVLTLLQYLGYVIKQLFGINIFKNAGVDKFQKSMSDSAKSAKEIKNQLASFDEMNVLSDNNNASDNGGNIAPSIDLSKMENQKMPKWLDTIVKVGKWILENWEDVVFTLLLIKLFIDLLTGNWIGVVIDLIGLLIIAFKNIWKNIKGIIDIIEPYWKAFIQYINNSINNLIGGFNKFKDKVINIWTIIRDKIKGMLTDLRKWLTNNFGLIGTAVGNAISNSIKSVINAVLRTIENVLNTPIRQINSLIGTINKVLPKKMSKLQTFSFPRLAKGGIVNLPSKGVPIGGAITGERGQEGVIPLTDSQQMQLLGEAIGKYITINATVVNSMNGRVLSREIQKVQNENNFAMNR